MKKKPKTHGLLAYLVFLPAALAGIGLVLSFLACRINPDIIFFPALFGLAFPLLFLAGFLLFLFNLALLRKRCLFFLACLLLNYGNLQNTLQVKGSPEPSPESGKFPGDIKLMTYNVRLFDFYRTADPEEGKIKNEILAFIQEQKPDIICFQEYYESKGKGFDITSVLREAGYRNSTNPELSGRGFLYGNRIYSRFPIIQEGSVADMSRFDAVYADLQIGKDTLRVYNLHLASNRFDKTDQEFVSSISSPLADASHYKKGATRMLKKMKAAVRQRNQQLQNVILHAESLDAPRRQIICGDLNDQAVSYTYSYLERKGFHDAFVEQGQGMGQSYKGLYPSYRIDYILHRGGIHIKYFNTWKVDYSDHRPLSAILNIR